MDRLRCPWCGAFLANEPTRQIICLPGHAYEWPEEGPPIVREIPPLPSFRAWICGKCHRELTEED